jgi:hypothetical protein
MGICCSKAKADLDDGEQGLGFPWMHDDAFHHHLWTTAAASMHTKQGWKGANQDAMAVCQVSSPSLYLPVTEGQPTFLQKILRLLVSIVSFL